MKPARVVNRRVATVEGIEPRVLLSASFASPVNTQISTTGVATIGIVVGDVNGDKIPDVVAIREDQTVEPFLGSATGTLTPGAIFDSGGVLLAGADFNKDGKLDLVTAGGVLLGKGDGTFAAPVTNLAFPANPTTVLTGDFNGDGNPDIVAGFIAGAAAGHPSNFGAAVLLGNGDGTFKAFVSTILGPEPGNGGVTPTLALGDFNGDGKLDLISPLGVSLGNGDGTFKAVQPLPAGVIPTTSAQTGTIAGSQLFAVGDFNGDGILDVATVQSEATVSSVTILLGKGDGTFTVGTPAALGASVPVTALDAVDVDGDGHVDLLVGTGAATPGTGTTGGIAGSLLVLGGNGDGTFAAPTSVAVSGAPVALFTADFNADGKPDVVSLVGSALGSSITGQLPGTAIDVLLNTSTTSGSGGTGGGGTGGGGTTATGTAASTVTLTASPHSVAIGLPVVLTARVTAATSPVPTGTVTFFDGSTALGTATLNRGKATLTTTAIPFGPQSLTATYNGNATYAAATSAAVSQTVLVTTARVPFLTFALGDATLTSPFLSGDRATIPVILQNLGQGTAIGSIGINLYLTRNGTIDSSAIPLGLRPSYSHAVVVKPGQTIRFLVPFSATGVSAGRYVIAAQIVAARRLTADEVTGGVATAATPVQASQSVFGTLGKHSHVSYAATDSSGRQAMISISGAGLGTIAQRGGTTSLTVTGTNASSVLRIVAGAGGFSLGSINVSGALARFDAPGVSLTGGLTISGGTSHVALAAMGGTGTGTTVNIGAGRAVSLTFGDMTGVTLQSSSNVKSLAASSWIGGAIVAPDVGRISIAGAMSANVYVHNGGGIQTIRAGAITGGTWAVPGGFTTLDVSGDVSGVHVYAGADAGADNVLGTADDLYKRASIGTILVGGNVTGSSIEAGAAPASGNNFALGTTFLPFSSIFRVTIGGVLSSDSRILAPGLAARAKVGGALISTASDPRFHL